MCPVNKLSFFTYFFLNGPFHCFKVRAWKIDRIPLFYAGGKKDDLGASINHNPRPVHGSLSRATAAIGKPDDFDGANVLGGKLPLRQNLKISGAGANFLGLLTTDYAGFYSGWVHDFSSNNFDALLTTASIYAS